METVDIVVYGGTVAGVAAAAKAAGNLKGIRDKKIALIIPDPVGPQRQRCLPGWSGYRGWPELFRPA